MFAKRALAGIVLALLATLLASELTEMDMSVQRWLYDAGSGQWLLGPDATLLRFFLYDGIKAVLVLTALALAGLLVLSRFRPGLRPLVPGMRMLLLSLLLVPATVSALKATTNVPCPRDLRAFGGELPYVRLFDAYPPGQRPAGRQRCFPAGHASGGFALIGAVFLFRRRRTRALALGGALLLGWSMGAYKMALGDHLLSHTLVSMELAWLLVALLVRCGLPRRWNHRRVSGPVQGPPARRRRADPGARRPPATGPGPGCETAVSAAAGCARPVPARGDRR